jgi:hypothetical protein
MVTLKRRKTRIENSSVVYINKVVVLIRKNNINMLISDHVEIWNQDRQQDVDVGRILLIYLDVGTWTK